MAFTVHLQGGVSVCVGGVYYFEGKCSCDSAQQLLMAFCVQRAPTFYTPPFPSSSLRLLHVCIQTERQTKVLQPDVKVRGWRE